MAITFDIQTKQANINEVFSLLGSVEGLKKTIGSRVTTLLKANFTTLDNTRANKLGGKRTHTWGDIGRSTSWETTEDGVRITISDKRFRQRLQGGVIRPRNGSHYLTIPANARAYDRRAREFNDLSFKYVLRDGRLVPALVESDVQPVKQFQRGKNKGKYRKDGPAKTTGAVMYYLVSKVTQAADPSALPKPKEIERTIVVAIEEFLASVKLTRKA